VAAVQPFSTVEEALDSLARGEIVIVVDDPERENEGDFVMAAEKVTPEAVNFIVTHGRGLLCLPIGSDRADRLRLRPMVANRNDHNGTAFTVSIDLADPPSTGISAADRAACIRRAASPEATADEFTRPGHIFPLRARPGGVLDRAGHTEAAVDLACLAGLQPAAAICEIMNDDGSMARLPDLARVARTHGLRLIRIADVIAYRLRREQVVRREAEARIPTPHGAFRIVGYAAPHDERHHVALVHGDPANAGVPLVRMQIECLTGDVFGSARCGCSSQLDDSLHAIAEAGSGVVLYLRRAEERALDLSHVTTEPEPGDVAAAAQMLGDLGIDRVRLLTDRQSEAELLEACRVHVVDRVDLPSHNVRELRPRRDTLAHELLGLERYELMA
jgi:3,4-dihydroxy 2-butanone 4-phosphate synthase / GTP cyclohydrolase II